MGFVLSVNAGSSSIKCAVYIQHDTLEYICAVAIENIGKESALLRSTFVNEHSKDAAVQAENHSAAMLQILRWIGDQIPLDDINMVGHRIVHGGTAFSKPTVMTQSVLETLHDLQSLDPDHLPAALSAMAAIDSQLGDVPQVACFDTAFFADLPIVATLVPVPKAIRDLGVRRYGFHGLSYSYLIQSFREHEGDVAANGRIIMAHLGSGASLAAISHGRPVDMTMGFTPASGIPMSTRSGDIDPGIVSYLARNLGQTAQDFDQMVNHDSGLLGISETTADVHELLQTQAHDPRAATAIELFCYEASKSIGALTTTLGGVDSIVFAGGIGERSPEIRQRICDRLTHLGVILDDVGNQSAARCISSRESDVGVHVIPTDESIVIAKQTIATIKGEQIT